MRRSGRGLLVFVALLTLSVLLTGTGRPAHAATLFSNSDICTISLPEISDSFGSIFIQGYEPAANGAIPSTGNMYQVFGSGSSWWWQAMDTSGMESIQQIACAIAYPGKQIVAYRNGGTVRVRERLTGWQESTILGATGIHPYAMWATATPGNDQFVLFVINTSGTQAPFTGHLLMAIRNSASGSPWGAFTDLGVFPGGIGIADFNSMSGYTYFGGLDNSARINVFFTSSAGDLIENRGSLDPAARTFVNHGHPAAGFHPQLNRVGATAFKDNSSGHPPPYAEAEWQTELRTLGSDGNVYAKHAFGALATAPWESTAAGGVVMVSTGGFASGYACRFNPCSNRTLAITTSGNLFNVFTYDALTVAPLTRGPWILQSAGIAGTSPSEIRPTLMDRLWPATGTQFVYPTTGNNLVLYDLPTGSALSLGHP